MTRCRSPLRISQVDFASYAVASSIQTGDREDIDMQERPDPGSLARAAPPRYASPPLIGVRPPRCPPFVKISSSDQLLPYLEHVARRPYNNGLNACWDLKPGERVL